MENIAKVGDIVITQNKDEYRILEVHSESGYLIVQPNAYYKIKIEAGKEMIHKSELINKGGYWEHLG